MNRIDQDGTDEVRTDWNKVERTRIGHNRVHQMKTVEQTQAGLNGRQCSRIIGL